MREILRSVDWNAVEKGARTVLKVGVLALCWPLAIPGLLMGPSRRLVRTRSGYVRR